MSADLPVSAVWGLSMREYGQIQCSYWQRACEEGWSNDATLLGAYLLAGPHSNGIGCYRLPNGYVSDDLGWSSERVSKGFAELFEKGFCKRFGTVVLVPKFLRWNRISNANVAKARQTEFEAIPNDEAKRHAAFSLLRFGNHWEKGFERVLQSLSKGLGKQEPTLPNPNQKEDSPNGECGSQGEPRDRTPCKQILDLYHSHCPSLPDAIKLTPARQQAIRARWRNELPTLEDWSKYFKTVEMSDFLSGRAQPNGGRQKPFRADLDFLIKQGNCLKVMEGKYDN